MFQRSSFRQSVTKGLVVLFTLGLSLATNPVSAQTVEPTSVRKLFSDGKHNAFTALIHFKEFYYLAFRNAPSHGYGEADIVLLRSKDAETWTEMRRFNILPDDRDPQFLVAGDRLMMYVNSLKGADLTAYETFTSDGESWSEPQAVYQPRFILWKPLKFGDRYLATSHKKAEGNEGGKGREVHLIESPDAIDWKRVSAIRAGNWESETTLFAGPGETLTGFLRTKYSVQGHITESSPPYQEWKQRPAGIHFSGHCVHTFRDVTYLFSRTMDDSARQTGTAIYIYADGKPTLYCTLPSGGDCSYPEVALIGDEMVISYYSSHEGAANIYLAHVPLKR